LSYVRIVSKRAGGVKPQPGEKVVPVDRTNPVLGNKSVLENHTDGAARARVIAEFEERLALDLAQQGPMSRAIEVLAELVATGQALALECWCAQPKNSRPCHATSIRGAIADKLGRSVLPPGEVPTGQPVPNVWEPQGSLF
jgi:hypothetical protein